MQGRRGGATGPKNGLTSDEATEIAQQRGLDLADEPFDQEQFRMGLDVEFEHGRRDPATNVTDDDSVLAGKIALAHLRELPDSNDRTAVMEDQAGSK